MKKSLSMPAAVCVAALCLWGCGRERPLLHICSPAGYVKPELLERFEREFHCRVVVDNIDAGESLYAKLQAGVVGYDLVLPRSHLVGILFEEGMLQSLRRDLVPNLKHVDASFPALTGDPTMHHSVPYLTVVTGVGYIDGKVSGVEASWSVFDRQELSGRMTLLDDMRETLGAALKFLGYSINSTDDRELAEARDVVIRWKRNIAGFESERFDSGLASEEFLLVHGYRRDVLQSMEDNKNVTFFVPREGASLAGDHFCIPAGAHQVELAHRFINFFLDPAVSAENMLYVNAPAPNRPAQALLRDEVTGIPAFFVPADARTACEAIRDLGEDNAKYTRMWDEVKAAR